MVVTFYGLDDGKDVLIGKIATKGDGLVVREASSEVRREMLQDIIDGPLAIWTDGVPSQIMASDDPERFLTKLREEYSGAALRASKAMP